MDIAKLSQSRSCRSVAAGQRLAALVDAKEMYVLLNGVVEVFSVRQGGLVLENTLQAGMSFGAHAFLWGDTSEVYRARGDVSVFVVTELSIRELMVLQPMAAMDLLRDATAPRKSAEAVVIAPAAPSAPQIRQTVRPSPVAPKPVTKMEAQSARSATPLGGAPQKDTGGATVRVLAPGLFPEGHAGYPGITRPEYAQFAYEKEYACPNCSKTFKDSRVFQSKLVSAAPMRFDMRETFVDFAPEWYEIVTCPYCYFSMLSNYFNDPKNFFRVRAKQAMDKIYDEVALDLAQERDLEQVFARHYLALASASGYINQKQLVAKLWGNLSWLYEDAGDEAMEKYAAGRAAAAYIEMFQSAHPTAEQEQIICLTISGMLLRSGEPRDIKRWLFNVKANKEGKRVYADLADDILDKIKDEEEDSDAE